MAAAYIVVETVVGVRFGKVVDGVRAAKRASTQLALRSCVAAPSCMGATTGAEVRVLPAAKLRQRGAAGAPGPG